MFRDPERLRLARWYDVLDSVQEAVAEENEERWRRAAFVGWQFGAGGKQSFGEYLRTAGLGYETRELGPQQVQRTGLVSKEVAMANAERALTWFREHPGQKRVFGRSKQLAECEARRERRRARRVARGG